MRALDEFGEIARLFRPLTQGTPESLALCDDAAVLAPPSSDERWVVSTDTIVEGVHFLSDTPPGLVAKKLLRVNLSDLAAKAATPWGWFLNIAWPTAYGLAEREAFAAALAEDQAAFGLSLFGGDTVATPGPLTATALVIGRAPPGGVRLRGGARAGDVLLVSGTIGDAALGLEALRERGGHAQPAHAFLVARHQQPTPRLGLAAALRAHARAAADVSDGLLADAGHLASASGLAVEVELDAAPLSSAAADWALRQPDAAAARLRLCTGGDDYEIVCAADPGDVGPLMRTAAAAGTPFTPLGRFLRGDGVRVLWRGEPVAASSLGWRHG